MAHRRNPIVNLIPPSPSLEDLQEALRGGNISDGAQRRLDDLQAQLREDDVFTDITDDVIHSDDQRKNQGWNQIPRSGR